MEEDENNYSPHREAEASPWLPTGGLSGYHSLVRRDAEREGVEETERNLTNTAESKTHIVS